MLVFDQPTKDLGTLPNGQVSNFTVQLQNNGQGTIVITNIRPGCGSCTTARVNNIQLVPRGTSTLFCTFTPAGLGANYKKIFIDYSLDGIAQNTVFSFNANVI
jgi:hypothetical protein